MYVFVAEISLFAKTARTGWDGLTQSAILLALILGLLAGAIKMVRDYRRNGSGFLARWTGRAANSADDAHLSLTNFRELHAKGGLSDSEYRIIKQKLASELKSETSDPAINNTSDNSSEKTATLSGDSAALTASLIKTESEESET